MTETFDGVKSLDGPPGSATIDHDAPDSPECEAIQQLADNIYNNKLMTIPEPMSFDELHHWWQANKTLAA